MNEISVEFNLKVGCKNACKYCPQDRYLKAYKGNERELSLESFKLMLNNIPLNTTLIFAGFSEPFFNKDFPDMLIYANELKYNIKLFTTLKGFNKDISDKLITSGVKFKEVYFHMFNGVGFDAKEFAEGKKLFRHIYAEHSAPTVVSSPVSRSNLPLEFKGPMKSVCHKAYSNVIDIDGNIYLCCMDWDLKCKLGNIFLNKLDSDEVIASRNEVIKNMQLNESNLICRKCEFFDESRRK
jgi:radical SAM protein with 4Fe4S-binding SPASM domain